MLLYCPQSGFVAIGGTSPNSKPTLKNNNITPDTGNNHIVGVSKLPNHNFELQVRTWKIKELKIRNSTTLIILLV